MSRLLTRRHFVLSGLTAATIPLLAACSAPAPAAPTAAPKANRGASQTDRGTEAGRARRRRAADARPLPQLRRPPPQRSSLRQRLARAC